MYSYRARWFKTAVILAYSAEAPKILTENFQYVPQSVNENAELDLKLGQPLPFTPLSVHY
jgi:hypothetical protein